MKHHALTIIILCLALLCCGCDQDTLLPTELIRPTTEMTEASLDSHTHIYRVTEELAATCTEDGCNVVACHCGDSYSVTTDMAKGHDYTVHEVVLPTDTEWGYTLYVCRRCDETKKTDETHPLKVEESVENLHIVDNEGYLLYYYTDPWVHSEEKMVCEEPVLCYADDSVFLYFVKETEPTKLYYAPLTDLLTQEVIYESNSGPINYIQAHRAEGLQGRVLTLVLDAKTCVLLDLTTLETELVLTKYNISQAKILDLSNENGVWKYNRVSFVGGLDESEPGRWYFYWKDIDYISKDQYIGAYYAQFGEHLKRLIHYGGNIYFVKESEPTKLHRALREDFSQQELVYESDYGAITACTSQPFDYLLLIEENRRCVLYNIELGTSKVMMEQYYMEFADIEDIKQENGRITYNIIAFYGKLHEDDEAKTYLYHINTGEITEVNKQ